MRRRTHTAFSRWLLEHGLTPVGLANELGITRSAVYRWAAGTAAPTRKHLRELQLRYGTEITLDLFDPPAASEVSHADRTA